jgi:hypothetical protein
VLALTFAALTGRLKRLSAPLVIDSCEGAHQLGRELAPLDRETLLGVTNHLAFDRFAADCGARGQQHLHE